MNNDFPRIMLSFSLLGIVTYLGRLYILKKNECKHDYYIIQKTTVVDENRQAVGFEYVQRCTKCGKIEVTKA